jgi:hypothetical protein
MEDENLVSDPKNLAQKGQIRRRESDSSNDSSTQLHKKERLDDSTEIEYAQSDFSHEKMAAKDDSSDDIVSQVLAALSQPKVIEQLSGAFAKQIVFEINADLDQVRKQGEETVTRVNHIDQRLEDGWTNMTRKPRRRMPL